MLKFLFGVLIGVCVALMIRGLPEPPPEPVVVYKDAPEVEAPTQGEKTVTRRDAIFRIYAEDGTYFIPTETEWIDSTIGESLDRSDWRR